MPDNLSLDLALARLAGAQAALAAAKERAEAAPEGSDELWHAACALIPLRHVVRAAEVDVVLARGPTS